MVVVSPYQCSKQASECSMSSNRRGKSIPLRSSSRDNGSCRKSVVAHFFPENKGQTDPGRTFSFRGAT